MINEVDEDANIEFGEFLKIIKNSKGGSGQGNGSDINDFFKQMTAGQMGSEDLSFNMLVQQRRRKHMLDAILLREDNKDIKKAAECKKGKAILNAVKESLKAQMQRIKDAEQDENAECHEENGCVEILMRAHENNEFAIPQETPDEQMLKMQ